VHEAEAKFNEDHRDEIEAAIAYQKRDPAEDEDEGEKEAAPVMPVFNKKEFLAKWFTDNPHTAIPHDVIFDVDNDLILSP
jgi:hypothetical protein